MPHLGCPSLIVVARLTSKRGILPSQQYLVMHLSLGRSYFCFLAPPAPADTPMGALAPVSGSWKC